MVEIWKMCGGGVGLYWLCWKFGKLVSRLDRRLSLTCYLLVGTRPMREGDSFLLDLDDGLVEMSIVAVEG